MPICKRCGKSGPLLPVNEEGLCKKCAAETGSAPPVSGGIRAFFRLFSRNAREQELLNLENLLAKRRAQMQTLEEEIALLDRQKQAAEKETAGVQKKAASLLAAQKALQYAAERYFQQDVFPENIRNPEGFADLEAALQPTVTCKLQCLNVKELRQRFRQNEKQIDALLAQYRGRYTTKANNTIYDLMVIALRAELQNVLCNIGYGKLDSSLADIRAITQKYLKIATEGNQTIAGTMTKFIGELEYFFLEAVRIEYEYHVKKERAKEEQRAIREQMRQEAAERKLLEEQRKQIEREESKYAQEMAAVSRQMQDTQDDEKLRLLRERLAELERQLGAVADKKEEILRLQNGKAGYVYVISNLGSFGNHTFKIGMTRRLEPMERIAELSSASVPFPFDVHSMIFSEDAPALENSIHKRLHDRRVNKINLKKEFFDVSLDELESLVNELQPSAEFTRTMAAEQYFQSQSIEGDYAEFTPDDDTDDDEELETA